MKYVQGPSVHPFSNCCTADSQSNEDKNQLHNNLKTAKLKDFVSPWICSKNVLDDNMIDLGLKYFRLPGNQHNIPGRYHALRTNLCAWPSWCACGRGRSRAARSTSTPSSPVSASEKGSHMVQKLGYDLGVLQRFSSTCSQCFVTVVPYKFLRPAWAVGSYSIGPLAGEAHKSSSLKPCEWVYENCCTEFCRNIPARFWEWLAEKLRHSAVLGWVAEHFEDDSGT